MRAYKVVRAKSGGLWSATNAYYKVMYKKGMETRPLLGRLYVFLKEGDARLFACNMRASHEFLSFQVWEADCRNLYKEQEVSYYTAAIFINGFWKLQAGEFVCSRDYVSTSTPPPGTWSTDAVTLTKLIKDYRQWGSLISHT